MAVYLQGRYLSLDDIKFVQAITCDIYYYLKECNQYLSNILLFPPILSHYRFLIHKTIEEFPSLISFSIGEGDQRKTIIARKDLTEKMQKVPRKKRPDRALYVPKHYRSQEENFQSLNKEIHKSNEKIMIKNLNEEEILDSSPIMEMNTEEYLKTYLNKTEISHLIDTLTLKNKPLINNSNICSDNNAQSSPLYYQTSFNYNELSDLKCSNSLGKEIYNSQIPNSRKNNAESSKTMDDPNSKISDTNQLTKKLKKKCVTNSKIQNKIDDLSIDSQQNDIDKKHLFKNILVNESIIRDVKKSREEDAGSDDSWNEIFKKHGDLLKEEECEEICGKVGKVSIQSPQFDYHAYTPREIHIDEDEFGHLLEIYDFPAELKSEDIHLAFLHISNTEFDIKWVDDTHAILVFSSIIDAKAATLGFNNPKMKLRPINWASRNTKLKVKKFSGLLLPYKARPVVVANVARNMVANALGVRLNINKEILNREKKIIRDARDSKKAIQKAKQAAWDGFVDA